MNASDEKSPAAMVIRERQFDIFTSVFLTAKERRVPAQVLEPDYSQEGRISQGSCKMARRWEKKIHNLYKKTHLHCNISS